MKHRLQTYLKVPGIYPDHFGRGFRGNGKQLFTSFIFSTFLSFCFLIFSSTFSYAQTTISGKVSSESGTAVPYANIILKGTYDGASSAVNGTFSFTTDFKGKATIIATCIGFDSFETEIEIADKPLNLNIKLFEKATEMNTVTITAGSFEASDTKKAVILKPLDIVTTAGASGDIDGAIKTLPGAQAVGESEGLFVRGGSASETKTIIDDMVVQNPYASTVPDVPGRGRFTPFLFKGTAFSTGGYSALYGQALSSTLVLNTEDLADESHSSVGITMVGLSGGHTHRWKNTSLSVDGSYTNLQPFFAINPQNSQRDWIKVPETGAGSIILRQKTSSTGIFKIYGSFSKSKLGIRFPDLYDSMKTTADFTLENQNIYINSSYKEALGPGWNFFAGTSYSDNVDKIQFNQNKTPGFKSGITSSQQNTQGKFYFTRYLGKTSTFKFGSEAQNIIYGQDSTFNSIWVRNHNVNEIYVAGFAELELLITRKLAIRVGERSEYSHIINKYNNAPRTSIAYKTGIKSQISFAYGKFFETPQKDELFLSNRLTFENCTHYITNYQVMDDKHTFRVEAYYKQYNDLVSISRNPSPISGDTTKIYTENNGGDGYARGVDVFWRDKSTFKNVDYWISYTYLDTKRKYRYYPEPLQPTFATPHTVSVVYKQFVEKLKTSFGMTYTFATGRPYYFFSNPPTYSGPDIKGTTINYNNLSVNASYLTNIGGNFTVIFLSVNNILGINNIFGYRFSPDGMYSSPITAQSLRTIFVGMFISIGTKVTDTKK